MTEHISRLVVPRLAYVLDNLKCIINSLIPSMEIPLDFVNYPVQFEYSIFTCKVKNFVRIQRQ